jgi:sigma-B regulation protein RsbU (phosphoserine phosphatase)
MNTDSHKLNQTLADELQTLQQKNAQLKKQLAEMARQHSQLRRQLDFQYREVEVEQAAKSRTVEALQLAELIIDKSPAILFRRLASDDLKLRKMVYVSPNISRFGYSAEEFLSFMIRPHRQRR